MGSRSSGILTIGFLRAPPGLIILVIPFSPGPHIAIDDVVC
jgi:hypothetical protein